jgi:anti-sigma regulatory factor (Ser/Thr protein kinase)
VTVRAIRAGLHRNPERFERRLAALSELAALRDAVAGLLARHGVPDEVAYDVVLAVQEAAKNALARCDGRVPPVRVVVECDEARVDVEIVDPGKGFDLGAVEAVPVDPWSEHGRGLLLIRRLMDSLSVECRDVCVVHMSRGF